MPLSLRSAAFANKGQMPARFSRDHENRSPPLSWSGVPRGTKSLALIVDDPDAPDPAQPKTTWVHWVVCDLPPGAGELIEGASPSFVPDVAREGLNDWREIGWGGPAPPVGVHRYVHKLFALDTRLPELRSPTKAELEKAMEGHVLAQAKLIGTYAR